MTAFLGQISSNPHGLLGISWNAWKIIGWLGNTAFFTRFLVQWYATERKRQVVVPTLFWWLSLAGSLLLLTYAIGYSHDKVFICSYVVAWIPYVRNLIIHHRTENARRRCPECGELSAPNQVFCGQCGARLTAVEKPTPCGPR